MQNLPMVVGHGDEGVSDQSVPINQIAPNSILGKQFPFVT
jgi:hypothetical protein